MKYHGEILEQNLLNFWNTKTHSLIFVLLHFFTNEKWSVPKNSTGIKIKIYIQTNMGFCIPKNYVVGHFIKQKPFIYEELTTYFLCLIE